MQYLLVNGDDEIEIILCATWNKEKCLIEASHGRVNTYEKFGILSLRRSFNFQVTLISRDKKQSLEQTIACNQKKMTI